MVPSPMRGPSAPVAERLRALPPGGELRFNLRDCPLDEVLLTVHESRFTGAVDLGALPEVDRLYLSDGAVVGVVGVGGPAMQADPPADPAGAARRRLLQLYERPESPVWVREGLDRLAGFQPTWVDVRPVIAFGLVVKAAPVRKQAILADTFGKRVRLVAPYDERRNGYGLPPPVLHAMRLLAADGVVFDGATRLPGLDASTTAGLLLLLHRMSLLRLEDVEA